MMTCAEVLIEIMRRRGYIVAAHPDPRPIGDIMTVVRDGGYLPQPFFVLSRTTYEDWLEEAQMVRELGAQCCPATKDLYFYRMGTD
jgi:hypothetical protein